MITRIKVDGFKSLTGFLLDFVPGLNILVGPNGSGKTNIVSFFEFLSHLMETDASEATSRVGGAGAVFRRIQEAYENRIRVQLVGCTLIPSSAENASRKKSKQEKPGYCVYDYSFSLLFPDTRDKVLFQEQRFKLKFVNRFLNAINSDQDPAAWDLDISSKVGSDGSPEAHVNEYAKSLQQRTYHLSRGTNSADAKSNIEESITKVLASNVSLANITCRFELDFWPVINDLKGGQIYNIVPSRVKLPEDAAKPTGIARDGSGLAATLYALQQSKHPGNFLPWNYLYWYRDEQIAASSLEELKQYLQLVNTTIEDISVANDTFDNQLRVRFDISSGDYKASVPMALMSDGTLKWLAVVTAALTAPSVFCIEEPENYLHPQMQGQVVQILREILFRQQAERFTLMTTHSETLLNHCRPDELVIISMADGKTIAKRCSNATEISDEIKRTGFGLGYYYTSDALQDD